MKGENSYQAYLLRLGNKRKIKRNKKQENNNKKMENKNKLSNNKIKKSIIKTSYSLEMNTLNRNFGKIVIKSIKGILIGMWNGLN